MKKSILIPILVVSILVVVGGTTAGLWFAFTPTDDSTLVVESATADSETGTVTVELSCEGNETGHNYRHQRNFAYMHQFQVKNASNDETLYQEQYTWQFRHRIQAGKNMQYQYHIEGLQKGQMIQLRIEYNNGKVLTYSFMVNN